MLDELRRWACRSLAEGYGISSGESGDAGGAYDEARELSPCSFLAEVSGIAELGSTRGWYEPSCPAHRRCAERTRLGW